MPTLEFSFQTGSVSLTRIINGMAITYGYQATVPDPDNPGQSMPNPVTKAAFAKSEIKRIIVEAVHNAEKTEAINTAAASVAPITLQD